MEYDIAIAKIESLVQEIDDRLWHSERYNNATPYLLTYQIQFYSKAEALIKSIYSDNPQAKADHLNGIQKQQSYIPSDPYDYCRNLSDYLKHSVITELTTSRDLDKERKSRDEAFKELTSAHRKLQDEHQEALQTINQLKAKIESMEEQERLQYDLMGSVAQYSEPLSEKPTGIKWLPHITKVALTIISCAFLIYISLTLPSLTGYPFSNARQAITISTIILTGVTFYFGERLKQHFYWILAIWIASVVAYAQVQ